MVRGVAAVADRAYLVATEGLGTAQDMFLQSRSNAVSAIRLLHSEGNDFRLYEWLSVYDQRRMAAVIGTDLPDHVHKESDDPAILFGNDVVAGKSFEIGAEYPVLLPFSLDYFDVFLPLRMLRCQLMDHGTRETHVDSYLPGEPSIRAMWA